MKEFVDAAYTCHECNYHERIEAKEYLDLLFEKHYETHYDNWTSKDFLEFVDSKSYQERLRETKDKTGLKEALVVASGKIHEIDAVIAVMDFSFIGGSMGTVVGEKIVAAIEMCIKNLWPLVIISKSGGARMMESAFSLMQMVKTSAKLTQLTEAKLPYISVMTDPTTGGVSASFAMLGDLNIAEPGALIGFAGPRVIQDTIKKELPEDFQKAECLLENGFLDFIVDRKEMKDKLAEVLRIMLI